MFKSIRQRIAIPYVVLTLLVMLVLGIYLAKAVRQWHLDSLKETLTAEAKLITDSATVQFANTPYPTNLDNLANHWSDLLGARVTLIAADGVVIGESHEDRSQMDNHRNRVEVQQALQDGIGYSTRFSHTVGYDMMYLAIPIEVNGEILGFGRVALPLEEINTNINALVRTVTLITLIATILMVAIALFTADQIARPLRELTQTAQQVTEGNLNIHLSAYTDDEVGQMTHTFNKMVGQIRGQIAAMESEQSKLAAVLDQMTDGVIIVNEQETVELINPAAQRLFNISAENALGRSLAEVVRQHQLVMLWQECLDSGEEQSLTLELVHQQKFVQSIILSFGEALPGQYLLLFQDLTRMRRLETVRRDFISNISHELRTPLASLKALAETLKDGALDDPPMAVRFLGRMDTEVDALTHMVSELLELTRIESGQVPLEFKPVRPIDLLNAAVERLGVQANRADLQLGIDCSEEIPEVTADPPRLGQALVNLLHNAIKFTPPGGKIILSAYPEENMIVFAVSDTGVGIPADDLPRIFERFYKADRARSGGGTGLGLAITRHLVEAHGGKIWAESIEGQGSTFFFTIPVVR